MLHYGLFYLHGSRHRHSNPYPPRSGGGGPRRPRLSARSAVTLGAVVLCLGGAGYAAASQDGGAYGDGSDPVKAQPQADAKSESHSRPGRLGAGPLR
jgi:hypothetical protein